MARYERSDWARLGQAVFEARTEAGAGKTVDWEEKVQRSSRVLLGLERGEKVGTGTLEAIEDALGWPRGGAYRVLTGGVSWRDFDVLVRTQEQREEASLEEVSAALAEVRRELRETQERLRRLEQATG